MSYELLISEKPQSALKIAEALADNKPKKHLNGKIPYYELTHKNKKMLVGCAVGHLFTLKEKNGGDWNYPIFTYEWVPVYEANKDAQYTKDYINTLQKLSKQSNSFVVCTDYDEEGSLLGERIIHFICKQKDAKRMKFSSLTKQELQKSYENVTQHLDWPQVESGQARHELDWLYGINGTRALTKAVKNAGNFKIISTGRVQGPMLKILTDLEFKIEKFKSEPYWQIQLLGKAKLKLIEAWHKGDKIWEKDKANKILITTKNKEAIISNIEKTKVEQIPPYPFDLTTMQVEAYRVFKMSPKETLQLAQNLYIQGLITYPRTSSQQIPPMINYKEIIKNLSKQIKYKEICNELLNKKTLKPSNGKKTDPAHPACIVTGDIPKKLTEREGKLYDLITRRFLATFSESAFKENTNIEIDCNKEIFIAKGSIITAQGWYKYYQPYVSLEERLLPDVKKGDKVIVEEIKLYEKETKPPKRYTPASLVKELEKKNIGTKTTRSIILDILYDRNYLEDKAIKVTPLGKQVSETLEKYVPDLVSEELTRHFEKELEKIQQTKKTKEKVLEEAKKVVKKISAEFKSNEEQIGKSLLGAIRKTQEIQNVVGTCPNCKGNLTIRKSKYGNFIGCSNYPKCKTTMNLPNNALIKSTNDTCNECKSPIVLVIRKGKRPWKFCINESCPVKLRWIEEQQRKPNKI